MTLFSTLLGSAASRTFTKVSGTPDDDVLELQDGFFDIYTSTGTDTLIVNRDIGDVKLSAGAGRFQIKHEGGIAVVAGVEVLQFHDVTFQVELGTLTLPDVLNGGAGDDLIFAFNYDDMLNGFGGSDYLIGSGGADRMDGGSGSDRLYAGRDDDVVAGGSGRDHLWGERGIDRLSGGAGQDRLDGGKCADILNGGRGNDRLFGGEGRDELNGGRGNDRLNGGAGNDAFHFRKGGGRDMITDFEVGADTIHVGKGAQHMRRLEFQSQENDVLVTFSDVEILVKNVTVEQIQNPDNFVF